MDTNEENKTTNKINWKTHLFYISGILIAIIAIQFGFRTDLNNTIISNIATVTSIILSILAIIITVVSSFSTSNFMHIIRDIAYNIKDIPQRITASVNKLDSSADKLDKIEEIGDITKQLRSIEEKFSCQLDKLNILPELNKDLKSFRADFENRFSSEIIIENKLENNDEVSHFPSVIKYGTASGLILICVLSYCFKNKLIFNRKKYNQCFFEHLKSLKPKSNLSDGDFFGYTEYNNGYMGCLKSLPELFDMKFVDTKEKYTDIEIKNINKEIVDSIDNFIDLFTVKFKDSEKALHLRNRVDYIIKNMFKE